MTQIPRINFQTFVPEKCSELLEITESEDHRWIMHSYDASALTHRHDVEHWASWLTHHDLRAIVKGETRDLNRINLALKAAREITDHDFEDACEQITQSSVPCEVCADLAFLLDGLNSVVQRVDH